MNDPSHRDFTLEPDDTERLANLAGPFDAHLRQIELRLGVEIANRGNIFRVTGPRRRSHATEKLLRALYAEAGEERFDGHAIHLRLNAVGCRRRRPTPDIEPQDVAIRVKRGTIRGRGANQAKYLHAIATHDINFGVGPAGTGKTFLAVAMAVEALNESRVQRLILVRPAVEAGEKLGFLPGDLTQKVDPYLRPLYDALYEMLGVEKVVKLLEKNVIEIAPLAYMRGRTLNDAFVILDEAQNTTIEQMKMFLTRIGFGTHRGGHRRPDPDRPAQAPEVRPARRGRRAARRGRHQLHLLRGARRRAPSAGGAHRQCLRRARRGRHVDRSRRKSA